MSEAHFRGLERMYQAAPTNQYYQPSMLVSEGQAEITVAVKSDFFHAAGAVHGSVYFKLLDDAAFFAANSFETEVFVLTTCFTIYITRPISEGSMRAVGKVVNSNRSQWVVESVIYDANDREIGRGNGIMVRSKVLLADTQGYAKNQE